MLIHKVCQYCGDVFSYEKTGRGRLRRYCSKSCYHRGKEQIKKIKNPDFYKHRYQKRKDADPLFLKKRAVITVKYSSNNPEKKKARNIAAYLPLGERCENCGVVEDLQRHHSNYSKPKEFQTLCRSCHEDMHHNPTFFILSSPLICDRVDEELREAGCEGGEGGPHGGADPARRRRWQFCFSGRRHAYEKLVKS